MRRITLRLAIALFTFSLGVSAVLICYTQWRRTSNAMHVAFNSQRDSTIDKIPGYNAQPPFVANSPEIKWLYISDPIKWSKEEPQLSQESSIIVFYASGEWGRITPVIKNERESLKLKVETAEGYLVEAGLWKEYGTDIMLFYKAQKCYLCATLSNSLNELEKKRGEVMEGNLGLAKKPLHGPLGQFRLMKIDEFADEKSLETVIYAPLNIYQYVPDPDRQF